MNRDWSGPVLITGATGFLGRHLVAALVGRGLRVRALVRRPGAGLPGIEQETVAALDDPAGLRRALEGVATVMHLAAYVHQPGKAHADEAAHRAINLDGTVALLEAAVATGVRDFLFVSTVKAVGETSDTPWTEATPPRPVDPYGRSKLAAEQAVRAAADRHGLHAPILRLPLAYGPWMKANALTLFDLVERGTPLPLGRVDNRRSLVYVGNFVAAVQAVVEREAGNDLFFVSDGPPVSTPELIRAIARALDRPARLVPVPVGLMRAAGRAGDLLARVAPWRLTSVNLERMIGSLAVDSSKLAAVAGPPPFTLAAGLAATARWYRARSGT
ncbi:MAG TPA: NAD-dependent epimerase/dehydratase family protein [Gemmatimonadales bacterium]|nr:NAD-dependent epimerase/dehydratase family protein [Gemmatimonadales bacterium]